MKAITNLSVRVIERWLPDAFLFAIILTIVVFIAAMVMYKFLRLNCCRA